MVVLTKLAIFDISKHFPLKPLELITIKPYLWVSIFSRYPFLNNVYQAHIAKYQFRAQMYDLLRKKCVFSICLFRQSTT